MENKHIDLQNKLKAIKISINNSIDLKEINNLKNKYALIYKEYKVSRINVKSIVKKIYKTQYVYLIPRGGFNDILTRIYVALDYCRKTNRVLLLDTRKTCYKMCFDDYFYFKNIDVTVITDINTIETIFSDTTLSIYPDNIKDRDLKLFNFKHLSGNAYLNDNIILNLPRTDTISDIIVHVQAGIHAPETSLIIFKSIYFKQNIIDHVKEQFSKLPSPYLSIHVRNTDYKCDYIRLYETNKELIHSYNAIYIATDDKESLEFFKSKGLPIYNFTEFPSIEYRNLHYSSVDPDIKIKNVICDIYIIGMAEKLLTNSIGGFIKLCENIRKDINIIRDKMQ